MKFLRGHFDADLDLRRGAANQRPNTGNRLVDLSCFPRFLMNNCLLETIGV